MEIQTERVEIAVGEQTMGGYLARPEGDDVLPAVIVYMEIFGINSHIREVTERIAAEGFVALAPDYFHRTGPGIELGYDDEGMAEGMKHLGQLDAEQMIADAQAAVAALEGRDDVAGAGIGAMGFCIGGHMTYLTACTTDIQVSAPFYGGGIAAPQGPGGAASTVSRTSGIKGAMMCFFGGQDAMIPPDQVDAIRAAISDAGVRGEVVVYDDADHGFHCDQRDSYNPTAAKDAWRRVTELFAAELKG